MEVAPIDQRELNRRAPEPQSGLKPAEATTDHDDTVPTSDTTLAAQVGHGVIGSAVKRLAADARPAIPHSST